MDSTSSFVSSVEGIMTKFLDLLTFTDNSFFFANPRISIDRMKVHVIVLGNKKQTEFYLGN